MGGCIIPPVYQYVSGLREQHGLEPHRLLSEQQEYQHEGGTGQRSYRRYAARYANGSKDNWERQLPFAEFAINNTASTPGGEADMTPIFIDHCLHPRLPLSG